MEDCTSGLWVGGFASSSFTCFNHFNMVPNAQCCTTKQDRRFLTKFQLLCMYQQPTMHEMQFRSAKLKKGILRRIASTVTNQDTTGTR